jgi:hypothetical protein
MALETYRIIFKTSPVFIHDIVNIKQNSYNFRYNNTADIPRPRPTRYVKKSFSYEAARLWYSLPDQARNLSTFGTFKNFISTWCFFLKIVSAALVERSYLAASYQNSSSPSCFYVLVCFSYSAMLLTFFALL